MHEWCGWLEKNKIAWLSQNDGDAPLHTVIPIIGWQTFDGGMRGSIPPRIVGQGVAASCTKTLRGMAKTM